MSLTLIVIMALIALIGLFSLLRILTDMQIDDMLEQEKQARRGKFKKRKR